MDNGKKSLLSQTYRHGHELLILFHDRDARRNFTPVDHWLIKTVKPSNIVSEYEKDKLRGKIILEQMPFMIPFQLRVGCFRKCIENDKRKEGVTNVDNENSSPQHIIIKRSRLIEDGFHMLNRLRISVLKSTIRVKFYNDLGLAEAGIDQDGVFKGNLKFQFL
jgi:ubiquitin-protein ligase E3 B